MNIQIKSSIFKAKIIQEMEISKITPKIAVEIPEQIVLVQNYTVV